MKLAKIAVYVALVSGSFATIQGFENYNTGCFGGEICTSWFYNYACGPMIGGVALFAISALLLSKQKATSIGRS
jgi:hypothetical protein